MSGTSPPFASVIVPTYGRPTSLRHCLEALRAQDYPRDRFEIVVVDDGSPKPVDVPEGPGPPAVHLLRQENRGPASARNRGARRARGRILAFTDDDCRPRRDWLRRLVAALEAEPEALVGGRTENALASNPWSQASQDLVAFLYESFETSRTLRPFFTSNNLAASRSTYEEVGGFDETFPTSAAEDRDLSERWVDHGGLRIVDEAEVDHYHRLGLATFVRQHFNYGRGAVHLGRRRRRRGAPVPIPESPAFYLRMVTHPLRRHAPPRAVVLCLLVGVSQVATVGGMLVELLRPSPRTPLTGHEGVSRG